MTKRTGGTWFMASGCVYSQLGDGAVVRVALMDREEDGTYPVERDNNARYIVELQNKNVRREITEENLALALKEIDGNARSS